MTVIKKEDVKGLTDSQVRANEPKKGIVDCSGKDYQQRSRRPSQTRKKRRHWKVVV